MPNFPGKLLVHNSHAHHDTVLCRVIMSHIDPQLIKLNLALRRYELKHRRLPETLEQLVPSCIESLPLDPITMEAYRWSASQQRIYSVWRDQVDDGGDFEKSFPKESSPDYGVSYFWGSAYAEEQKRKASSR